MRLGPQLVLAFGFVAALSVAGLGWKLREDRVSEETERFAHEVRTGCDRIVTEMARQAESDRKLVASACQSGELVDRALVWVESGLDDPRRLALSRLVPEERLAFDLDELILATSDGNLLGADPIALMGTSRERVAQMVSGDAAAFTLRRSPDLLASVACLKRGTAGHGVGLVGSRRLRPLADRLARAFDLRVSLDAPSQTSEPVARASCTLASADHGQLRVFVEKPTMDLEDNLARIDRNVLYAGLASTGIALVLAGLLARSMGRPISQLAAEARKVASGEARPLRVRGPGEIAELARAFDTMLLDLEATRGRLAAANRVAAWREVARSVAHEVKNPLAPIRAAVETLRRLRARGDPAFDEYFDEATRTVLDEVHRISTIVTEFTRFARLPAPRPQSSDVADLARQVVRMHENNARHAGLKLVVEGSPPHAQADRDQIVQVLTNLVQNGLEAVAEREGQVVVTVAADGPARVTVTVSDNGPGIAPEVASRLFEPYVTTKARGTGLGLALAQRIAVDHHGELTCLPSSGGAAFRLVLPVAGPPGAVE
jgi:two-component system, NtrC family, nitrogen regulation sensor histidine kinase NtrY